MKILIPNFGEYQHYSTRRPPWIKLHRKLLENHDFWGVDASSQVLLLALWLLASERPIEDEHGVVVVKGGLDEINWRLRREFNQKNLETLKSVGLIKMDAPASEPLAPRKRSGVTERETERERESERERETPSPSAPAEAPTKKSWAREAAEDWDAHYGKGSSVPGRIGAALSPLVKAHGWPTVRPVWQRYIAEKDPQYASAQDFRSKYGTWVKGSKPTGKAHAHAEGLRAFVRGGMRGGVAGD